MGPDLGCTQARAPRTNPKAEAGSCNRTQTLASPGAAWRGQLRFLPGSGPRQQRTGRHRRTHSSPPLAAQIVQVACPETSASLSAYAHSVKQHPRRNASSRCWWRHRFPSGLPSLSVRLWDPVAQLRSSAYPSPGFTGSGEHELSTRELHRPGSLTHCLRGRVGQTEGSNGRQKRRTEKACFPPPQRVPQAVAETFPVSLWPGEGVAVTAAGLSVHCPLSLP